MKQFFKKLWADDRGAETVEWIAIAAVIIVVGGAAYNTIGVNNIINTGVSQIQETVNNSGSTTP